MSSLTTKYQATVPKQVREVLQLAAGDRIEWILDPDGFVSVRKAPADRELGALAATLEPEGGSADDDDAYAAL
jgi:AbrB family looped-hinge helix DNA binding protein